MREDLRTALYARVSSEQQAGDSTIVSQLAALEGHRQLGGWPACEMELSQVGGRDDNVRYSQLRRLSLSG